MSEELKTNLDDAKDFAQQAALEMKIKSRQAKGNAEQKVLGKEGAPPLSDKVAHGQDLKKQIGLEVDKKSRDAKLAVDKKAREAGADVALSKAGDSIVDAKDKLADAFTPATKQVEAQSARGVDISHVENARNERLEARRAEEKRRAERDAEREQERKRQELLDDMKEKASAVSGAVKEVADRASVAIGNAALSLKDSIDAELDERPKEKVTPRLSERGVDISSVQNARNEELAAEQRRVAEAQQKAVPDKGAGEKLKEKLDKAVDLLKQSYEEATTDPPKAVYVRKMSASGVDVSHCENPNNAALAAAEEEKLRAEKERELALEKARVDARLVEPGKEAVVDKSDSLKAKMSSLGDSLARAAHKLGDSIKHQWEEINNPPRLDVHEKKSESGVDTTSIANAENNKIGEEIKNRPLFSSASSSSSTAASSAKSKEQEKEKKKDEMEEKVIKGVLDAGVAVKEAVEGVKTKTASGDATRRAAPMAAEPSQQQPIAPAHVDLAATKPNVRM